MDVHSIHCQVASNLHGGTEKKWIMYICMKYLSNRGIDSSFFGTFTHLLHTVLSNVNKFITHVKNNVKRLFLITEQNCQIANNFNFVFVGHFLKDIHKNHDCCKYFVNNICSTISVPACMKV